MVNINWNPKNNRTGNIQTIKRLEAWNIKRHVASIQVLPRAAKTKLKFLAFLTTQLLMLLSSMPLFYSPYICTKKELGVLSRWNEDGYGVNPLIPKSAIWHIMP